MCKGRKGPVHTRHARGDAGGFCAADENRSGWIVIRTVAGLQRGGSLSKLSGTAIVTASLGDLTQYPGRLLRPEASA